MFFCGFSAGRTFQERHAEAWPLYERSRAILETILGPDHPDVAKSLNDQANLLKAQVSAANVVSKAGFGGRGYKNDDEVWGVFIV